MSGCGVDSISRDSIITVCVFCKCQNAAENMIDGDIICEECWNKDITIETWPGQPSIGMVTGKTEVGIKLTHLPTGATGQCLELRSQHNNFSEAIKRLKEKL